MKWFFWTGIALLVLFFIGKMQEAPRPSESDRAAREKALHEIVENLPIKRVSLSAIEWHSGGYGNIAFVSFTVINKNTYPVKDIDIRCTWVSESRTTLGSSVKTVYQRIDSMKSKRVSEFSMGFINPQTTGARCELQDAIRSVSPDQ